MVITTSPAPLAEGGQRSVWGGVRGVVQGESGGYLLVQGVFMGSRGGPVFKGCFLALHLIMSSPAAPASIVSEAVSVDSSDSSSLVGH